MKKLLLFSLFILFLAQNNNCKAIEVVKFKVIDAFTQRAVKPDSIVIVNQTKNLTMTITTDSSDLDLLYSSVDESHIPITSQILVSPNPFENIANLKIIKSGASDLTLGLYDVLGNIFFSKKIYLENGIHNFSLNTQGLNPGVYSLVMKDVKGQNFFKLVKFGTSSGISPSINYLGNEESGIVYNGKDEKSILLLNNDVYSFYCYAKAYFLDSICNKSTSDLSTNNIQTFYLQSLTKYSIDSGYIEIKGINYLVKEHKSGGDVSGHGTDVIDTISSNFKLQINLKNQYLNNEKDISMTFPGSFITCYNNNNDSMITDFCYKTWYQKSGYDYDIRANTITSKIQFKNNFMIIDTMLINLYNRKYYSHFIDRPNVDQDDKAYTWLTLHNLPFNIDSLNNLIVEIKGQQIKDFIYLSYSRNYSYSTTAYHAYNIEEDNIIGLDKVADDAYIKITLFSR
jgi:hypothetical protein